MKRAWNALGIALALGFAGLLSATARAESTSRLADLRGALHAAEKNPMRHCGAYSSPLRHRTFFGNGSSYPDPSRPNADLFNESEGPPIFYIPIAKPPPQEVFVALLPSAVSPTWGSANQIPLVAGERIFPRTCSAFAPTIAS